MMWTGLEKVLVYGVNFIQGVILARILKPDDFGLTAMLGIFLAVGGTLAESGLGVALVVHGGDERRALRWNLGFAAFIYAISVIAAPFVARWYDVPVLGALLPVMALSPVFSSAGVVPIARLTRGERFRALALINVAVYFLSAITAVSLACLGAGVWSLAVAIVLQAVVRTSLSWWFAPKPENANADNFRTLLSFGWKLMLSNLIWNVYSYLHQIVIGKLWSPANVGLFVRGQRWAYLSSDITNDVVARVALPDLVKNGRRAPRYLLVNCLLLWPALAVLWIFAEEVVGFVLGAQWLECVPYLRILVFGSALSPFSNVATRMIYASGRGEYNLYCDVVKRPLGVVALAIGCYWGMAGLCWSYVAGELVAAIVDVFFALRLPPRREVGQVSGV